MMSGAVHADPSAGRELAEAQALVLPAVAARRWPGRGLTPATIDGDAVRRRERR